MDRRLAAVCAATAVGAARSALRRRHALEPGGRVALVTGGSRGLGFAIARRLVAEGARVAICARGEEALEEARRRLSADGADVLAVRCDVSDAADVGNLVREVETRLGPVELLVCNAGMIGVGALGTQRREDFATALDVHVWGILHPVLEVLPGMFERGEGRIANVTSIGGKVSVPLLLPYDVSKFAAVGLSEGLRAELAGTGVRVTTVVPGLMRTGSYLAAQFKQPRRLVYSLFAPVSSLPTTAVAAERAARRIVAALRYGDAEVTIGVHAKLAARAAGLAPGLTADALGLVARVLPDGDRPERTAGRDIESPVDSTLLTGLGRRAAADLNQ